MKETQKKELQETLSGFGLNQKDQDVYLVLLGLGQTSLSPLSQKTQLPLTTVQSVMKRLAKKGLVKLSKRKSRHIYQAHDPSVFKDLLKEQATALSGILPLLETLQSTTDTQASIRIFERERVTEILNESLTCKSKLVYEIVSAKPFQELIGEKYHYTKRRVREHIQLKSLRVRSTEIKKYNASTHANELREARFLPSEFTFEANILMWDNTLALLSTQSEGAHVLITSKSLHTMFQQLFDLLWSVSGKMETLVKNETNR